MNFRSSGMAALCAAGLLAAPAAASAAPTTIVAGPVTVKDYSMTLSATDNGSSDGLSIMFNRTAGKASQTHFYSFTKGVKVTTRSTLAAAKIKAKLGRYGKIDLKLTGVGAVKRGAVPKGCTGTASKMRRGKLNGGFKLVADSTYFKTIKKKSLKTSLFKGGNIKCETDGGDGGGSGGGSGSTTLTSTVTGADGMLTFSATKTAGGEISQSAMRMDDATKTAPASIFHMISAPGTSAAFNFAADLTSATGAGVTPFFSGTFNFAAESTFDGMAMGALTGDFAAKFDSIGRQSIASDNAMLMKG